MLLPWYPCRANDAVAMLLDKIRNRNPQVALAAMTVSLVYRVTDEKKKKILGIENADNVVALPSV